MELQVALIVMAIFLLAGTVKGVIGLGLPTVSLAGLSIFIELPAAVMLMVIPSAITNLWQAIDGPHFVELLRRFWLMLLASAIGVWFAYGLLLVTNPKAMTGVLGLTLCAYAAISLWGGRLVPRVTRERLASPWIGLTTGALAGATGSLVMPVVPYLQALELERAAFVQMLGISFTVSTVALGVAIVDHGAFDGEQALVSLVALVPALVGMQVGKQLRRRLSERVFRRCLFIGLLIIGLRLIWKGFY
ncbi:MAG: TSUP family transporter [Gammaproteobacteria bacterium]|nr:sulfite exporter TauE/SafE family protein [Gammaproteobacteria bacterium]NIV49704.1 TSUP family transporter [Gammaproteobacteria bacterium]NIW57102.1 TSUP family transporter [Gammaproteobacteria bacterium]